MANGNGKIIANLRVIRIGNSLGVTFPKNDCDANSLKSGTLVKVTVDILGMVVQE